MVPGILLCCTRARCFWGLEKPLCVEQCLWGDTHWTRLVHLGNHLSSGGGGRGGWLLHLGTEDLRQEHQVLQVPGVFSEAAWGTCPVDADSASHWTSTFTHGTYFLLHSQRSRVRKPYSPSAIFSLILSEEHLGTSL